MKVYVVLIQAARQGIKIGAKRVEWPIEISSRSDIEYDRARDLAVKEYAKSINVNEAQVIVLGMFS